MLRKILAVLFISLLLPLMSEAGMVGSKAPDFTLAGLDGKQVTLSELRGKVVFLDFWASWCPPCKKEMPELVRLSERFASDLVVVTVSVDRKKEHAISFMSTIGGAGGIVALHDPQAQVIARYRAQAMPTSFVIDRTGVIRFVHFGYRDKDPAEWVKEIDSLLK